MQARQFKTDLITFDLRKAFVVIEKWKSNDSISRLYLFTKMSLFIVKHHLFYPKCIGVIYSLNVWGGGGQDRPCFFFDLLIGQKYFFYFGLKL